MPKRRILSGGVHDFGGARFGPAPAGRRSEQSLPLARPGRSSAGRIQPAARIGDIGPLSLRSLFTGYPSAPMIYLVLNVVFASTFMLSIKWLQVRRQEDIITVGAINYIVAALIGIPEFLSLDSGQADAAAIVTGSVMGGCYFVCYFFVIWAIRWIGAAASTVIAVLSILLPIVCGIVIWHEDPGPVQVVGIVLALLSLTLIGAQKDRAGVRERPWFTPLVLLVFFLLCGFSRLAQEAFKHESSEAFRPVFLFSGFLVAAVPSLVLLVYRRRPILFRECLFGVLMGAANIAQTHFILRSLNWYDGFIVFPVTSAGGLMLVTLVATGLLGERLTGKTVLGVLLAVVALVLLHGWPAPSSIAQSTCLPVAGGGP